MTGDRDPPDHVRRNRAHWDELAADYVAAGERNWASQEPSWGIWGAQLAERGGLEGPPARVTQEVASVQP